MILPSHLLRRLAPVLLGVSAATAAEPDFGPNVLVMDPAMPGLQAKIDAVFSQQERNQFGPERSALLFKPGVYALDVQVGFYTQVAGLGARPDDVAIHGAVRSTARWMRNNNATCNFWRAVENLSVTPAPDKSPDVWAVSQGTALRRVHMKGDMNLWDGGWASGGFIADCVFDGTVNSGTQQQWLSRNADWGAWKGSSWNMVFVGVSSPPPGAWPKPAYTVVADTPLIAEKPFLFIDAAGHYAVSVPPLHRGPTRGASWRGQEAAGKIVGLDQFYLVHPERDSAETVNAALAAGRNLLFTPGVYHLAAPIRISRAGTIVLGLGYPTLVADQGNRLFTIDDVDGVRLGGLLLEAGPVASPSLLEVGPPHARLAHRQDPTFLYDISCRAGGAAPGACDCFVTINSHDVVADNFWLWRADHGKGAGWHTNPNANGLVVNGDDVTAYGLFVEHTQQYQTVWNGNGGRVYFYQSEMPYDPPSQVEWSHPPVNGYASYKVGDAVTTHEAWGLGVYCVFYKAPVVADSAIEAPVAPGIRFHDMVTLWLNGRPGSGISHIINQAGDPALARGKTARLAAGP